MRQPQLATIRTLVCTDPRQVYDLISGKVFALLSIYNDLKDGKADATTVAKTLAKTAAPIIGILVFQSLSRTNPALLAGLTLVCTATSQLERTAQACTVGASRVVAFCWSADLDLHQRKLHARGTRAPSNALS